MNDTARLDPWLTGTVIAVALHAAGIAGVLMLRGAALTPPPPEPVVMVELPPLPPAAAAAPSIAPQPDEAQPAPPPQLANLPIADVPPVPTPMPRDPVAAAPPQPRITPRTPNPAPIVPLRNPSPRETSAPATAAPASGSATSQGDDPRAAQQEADYRSLVRAYVARNRFSPPQSRREGLSGDIGVRFVVNRDGDISNVTIARSSGHDLLDSEAMEFIRRLTNVPEFPRDLRRSEIPLNVTLRFSLERR